GRLRRSRAPARGRARPARRRAPRDRARPALQPLASARRGRVGGPPRRAMGAGDAVSAKLERLLLVLAPAMAVVAVGFGLFAGGGEAMRAGVVRGAPRAAGLPFAWQVSVFDEDLGIRAPAPHVPLELPARGQGKTVTW